jgi:hypothetical protein
MNTEDLVLTLLDLHKKAIADQNKADLARNDAEYGSPEWVRAIKESRYQAGRAFGIIEACQVIQAQS